MKRKEIKRRLDLFRIREYVERIVPNYTAEEFKTNFRLFPATFEFLLELIEPALSVTKSVSDRKPIAAHKQLLIALWMMGTPDRYRKSYSNSYYEESYLCQNLNMMAEFERVSAFPNVIGAIDGTHINIRAPQEDKQSYVNRKGHHSIHVQAVCTQNLLFTSVLAGNVGSVHDAHVLREL